jgi:hypothetical protein
VRLWIWRHGGVAGVPSGPPRSEDVRLTDDREDPPKPGREWSLSVAYRSEDEDASTLGGAMDVFRRSYERGCCA